MIVHVGGALNEREEDGAVGNREPRYIYGAAGRWEPDPPGAGQFRQWVRDAWTQLRPFSTGGNSVNFQTADERDERIEATHGDTFDRLVAVKGSYDPENVFRSNRNVRPDARHESGNAG